ncbi:hypothetical protein VTO73DRAFT_11925 [Trametes versicolor]
MMPTSTNKAGTDQLARTPPAVPARAVSEEIQSPGFSKDAEFWFDDGTILLVSQNVGFRVYKKGLAERSPLFSDLLSIPQPGLAGSEETSGCPVVALTDSPDQLRHLFRALFSSGGHVLSDKEDGTVTMDVVAAIVRLSHKYQIESLLAEGLSILTEYYTDNFRLWIKKRRPTRLRASARDAFTAIDLGHLTDTPSILPLAYLYASDAGFLAPKDGCIDVNLARALLDSGEYARLASGRAAFIQASSEALARIVAPDADCYDQEVCGLNITCPAAGLDRLLRRLYSEPCQLHTWANEFKYSSADSDGVSDDGSDKASDENSDQHSITVLSNNWDKDWAICKDCRDMVIERELYERKRLWAKLPGMFSVEVDGWSAN